MMQKLFAGRGKPNGVSGEKETKRKGQECPCKKVGRQECPPHQILELPPDLLPFVAFVPFVDRSS